jgi:hypothetical protein
MPGFLDDTGYGGTTRVDLGRGYWCEVKNCLDAEENGFCGDLLGGKQQIDTGGQRQFASMDFTSSRREMVVQSLVAWNLTDPDGSTWLLLPETRPAGKPYPAGSIRRLSVARLPAPVFDQIFAVCDELNAPRKGADAVSFPDGPVGGDQDGNDGAAGPAAVPDGAGVLERTGDDQG